MENTADVAWVPARPKVAAWPRLAKAPSSLERDLALEDPLLVAGMFQVAAVWLCLAEVKEAWEAVYAAAGKCETRLSNQYNPNENACNYIEGIKIVRKDGIVVQGSSAKSKTAAVFIGIFSVSFILLGAYVYYLKTKLDRAKINLSE